jgi:hypothetical protein
MKSKTFLIGKWPFVLRKVSETWLMSKNFKKPGLYQVSSVSSLVSSVSSLNSKEYIKLILLKDKGIFG